MKTNTLIYPFLFTSFIAFSQEKYNPFEGIGKSTEVVTLSNGKYKEIYGGDTLKRIGSVIFDTKNNKVVQFLAEDDTVTMVVKKEGDYATRWLSLDPLAAKYPSMSPYNFVSNSPIIFIDPDGRENIYALNWARWLVQENFKIPYKPYLTDQGRNQGVPDSYAISENEPPPVMVCWESCWMAYMHSGEPIVNYLTDDEFARNVPQNHPFGDKQVGHVFRVPWTHPVTKEYFAGGINWFKNGKGDREYVTDISKGELGDIVFMGSETNPMKGHAALLNKLPTMGKTTIDGIEYESMKVETLSTGADGGFFGERTFNFVNKDGKWIDQETNYEFTGYGQMHNTKQLMNEE